MNVAINQFSEAGASMGKIADFYLDVQRGVEADGQKKFIDIFEGRDELEHLDDIFVEPGNFWVAQKQSQLIGCLGLRYLGAGIGLVGRFGVARNERRQGVGTRLMSALMAWAVEHDFTELMLTTQPTQHGMPIYKKFGFMETGEFDDYDGDTIMRVRM